MRSHVIFDLGGTLIDLRPLLVYLAEELSADRPALRPRSKELALRWLRETSASLARHSGPAFLREEEIATASIRTVLAGVGVAIDLSEAAELRRRAWGRFMESARLFDDVSPEWLLGFRELTRGVGIVTDGDEDSVYSLLDRLRLRVAFDAIVTSESVRAYKPDRRMYEAGLKALRADARHTLFVSDTSSDLRGADTLGMGLVLVRRELAADSAPPRRTVRLESIRELSGVVQRFQDVGGSGRS